MRRIFFQENHTPFTAKTSYKNNSGQLRRPNKRVKN